MARVHSHYENLKVARNAPIEVIRAAYKVLTQRHHPDVNPSPDSDRVMKILNEAWAVLSDPEKRAEHDRWLAEQESSERFGEHHAPPPDFNYQYQAYAHKRSTPPAPPRQRPAANAPNAEPSRRGSFESAAKSESEQSYSPPNRKAAAGIGIALLVALFAMSAVMRGPSTTTRYESPPPARYEPPQVPVPVEKPAGIPSADEFWRRVEPTKAKTAQPQTTTPHVEQGPRWSPNGKPWPTTASYVKGMPSKAYGGLSKLTIDNTSGGSDVYVKVSGQ